MTVLRAYADMLAADDRARYDEVVAPDGGLRPGWKRLADVAYGLTADDLRRVDGEVRRFLADDGVTHVRARGRGGGGSAGRALVPASPWGLDPLPLVLDRTAWAPLEIGLAQRAELLNALLEDLYGERRVLREGLVPAPVVLGHPGYLRLVARRSTHDPRPLVLAAADLGRAADGSWVVLADRTQAPSGLGYAVENRRVVSRVLPGLYRDAAPHRVEPFLQALRSSLLQSANGDHPDPRVVVLTPGARAETAYDQAAVASLLGFPLVQGSDLVVRGGVVHLRTAGRLEPVDVVLRRVDAAWTDPLELRPDSRLGVPGLAEAVRRGAVRVVNGLGAGVLESPALLPYLPALCEALLDEPLRLPSQTTWWCGDPDQLAQVVDRLDALVVRPAAGGAPLPVGEPGSLRARVLADPRGHVVQERPPLAQAPVWSREGVGPRPVSLRTFTLRYSSAYRPLLGGLATVLAPDPAAGPHAVRSISSKDVWVLKDHPEDADQGLAGVLPLTSVAAVAPAVPRVLEDLFWVGRYAERTEDVLRLVLVTHALAEDFRARPRSSGGTGLQVLLEATARLAGTQHPGALDDEFRSLLLDELREGSAAHGLAALRGALEGVRDQLSGDTWRVLAVADQAAAALRATPTPWSHQVAEAGERMLTGVLALHGVTASMVRDAGWHVLGLGRALERALQLCRLMESAGVRRGIDVDREVLTGILAASESAVTHRRRYRGYVRPASVLDLLLKDAANPRSLAASLADAATHLAALPASTGSSRPERLLDDLRGELAAAEVASLVAIGGVDRPNLLAFLDRTGTALRRLADAVAAHHLDSGPAPRTYGPAPTGPGPAAVAVAAAADRTEGVLP